MEEGTRLFEEMKISAAGFSTLEPEFYILQPDKQNPKYWMGLKFNL